jgi:hypothetical protein
MGEESKMGFDLPFELDHESFLEHGLKPTCLTQIYYMYRDADNFKTTRKALINGCVPPAVWTKLAGVLFDGTDILPIQLGLNALCPSVDSDAYDDDIDHDLHEVLQVKWLDSIGCDRYICDTTAKSFIEAANEVNSEGDWNFEQYGA